MSRKWNIVILVFDLNKKSKKQKLICSEGLTEQLFLIKKKFFLLDQHILHHFIYFSSLIFGLKITERHPFFIKKLGFLGDNSK